MLRRKAAADRADKVANARPASTRAAGAGGSSSTMLSMWFSFYLVEGILYSYWSGRGGVKALSPFTEHIGGKILLSMEQR